MASKEFTDYLRYSCDEYLKYVRSSAKAKALVGVRKIALKKGVFDALYFYLDKPLFSGDGISLVYINETNRTLISNEEYTIFGYDERKRILGVKILQKGSVLYRCSKESLFVESDLSFLIKRYLDFYAQPYVKNALRTPPTPELPGESLRYSPSLSEEQKHAVQTALTSPVSYIWGAPGTGKSSKVLADCVMNYVYAGLPVLILAPTNNAVDQSLRGVLRSLSENKIPRSRVLRFGIPSSDFQKENPDICENTVLQKRIEDAAADLQRLQNIQQEFLALERRFTKTTDFKRRFLALHESYAEFASLEEAAKKTFEETEKAYNESLAKSSEKHVRLIQAQQDLSLLKNEYSRPSLRFKMLFSAKIRHTCKEELKTLEKRVAQAGEEYISLSASCVEAEKIRRSAETKYSCQVDFTEAKRKSIYELFPAPCADLSLEELTEQIDGELSDLQEKMQDLLELTEGKSMEDRMAELKESISALTKIKLSQQEDILVYASTIDTFVGRISDFLKFENTQSQQSAIQVSHVFLDEAAYCSFSKCGPLFAMNAPVTLLGDHMQLPPICEADDKYIKDHHEIALWAISSLFFQEAVSSPFDPELYFEHYSQKKNINSLADFPIDHSAALTQTYRFGDNLASILAGCVYADSFKGVEKATAIYSIDTEADMTCKRENQNEANSISRYLSEHKKEDFAILTPFRAQRRRLCQVMPEYADRIMTVHASQGREFETVILSPASMHLMTNSNYMIGKQTLNTAISRAVNEIILCCNAAYWQKHEDQLISRLLQISTPME